MIRIAALAAAVALTSLSAAAQTAPQPKPAAKAKAKAPAKGKKAAAAAAVAAPVALAAASPEQLMAAERTHFGDYECDFKQTMQLAMNPKTPGYVDVAFNKKVYTMKPVLSSTGALRLEDVTGATLLIQIANKSMLMDVKRGQRLVDDCVHEKQRETSLAVKAQQANQPHQ